MHARFDHGTPTRRRPPSRTRTTVLWGAAMAVVLALLGGWIVATEDGRRVTQPVAVSPAGATGLRSLPWPEKGQAAVLDTATGRWATSGEQRPVPIASVTKVMTARVILARHPLRAGEDGPLITVDQQAEDESVSSVESTAPVVAGQRLTQRQVLQLLLLPSGNNIARLLARWDAGSEQAFTARMNRAAADLGMKHTSYADASGISPANRSTSGDQLRLARVVMRDPAFREIVATREVTVPGITGTVANSNRLLGTSGIVGGKTGSSTPAGGALMWAAAKEHGDGPGLILGVVLHQKPNTSPAQGLQAAFDATERLAAAAREEAAEERPVQTRGR
jgi:serine-type D-Ala-D-Ala carboxypeptidase (penicillin-binding protein 5/6)